MRLAFSYSANLTLCCLALCSWILYFIETSENESASEHARFHLLEGYGVQRSHCSRGMKYKSGFWTGFFFFQHHINMQLPRTPASYNDIRNPRMVFIILAVVPIGKLQALHMRFLPKVSLSSHSPHCLSLASRLVSTSVP
jgi:hypothetical protein